MQIKQFSEMGLSQKTLKAIEDMGYVEPSPIQSLAIPVIMTGRDIIGQAQTGTGKTAAFGIPIIEKSRGKSRNPEALVLTPTRELAMQVAEEVNKIARTHKEISVLPVYGGQDIERQIRALKSGINVVIGTPGRILDHIKRGTLNLSEARTVVLDEADEMLDMGFIDDITEILSKTSSPEKQTLLFSATMPAEIKRLASRFQKDPENIKVIHEELTVPKVKQYYYEVRERDKTELLTRLIDFYNPNLAIVFVKTKAGAEELKEKIHAAGYSVEGLHGDMRQTQRNYVMKRFRNSDFDILVATDVAARGIDVDDIDIVFNFDLPQDEEYYVHRIGRTARAGKEGLAISFVSMKEFRKLRDIEKFIKVRIERKQIPTIKDVEKMRNEAIISSIKDIINDGGLDIYMTMISEMLSDYTSLEVAAALLKVQSSGRNTESSDSLAEEKSSFEGENGYVRFFVNIGRKDDANVKDLLSFINKTANFSGKNIGEISLLDKFSFVEIPRAMASGFMDMMNGSRYKGRKVNVEVANKK